MKNLNTVAIKILFFIGFAASEVHPPVILTHNLGSGAIAYHGQRVIFTCTVRDIVVGRPIVISWRSDDYIGTGGDVLQVRSNARVGTTHRKMTTMVTLTNRTRNSGTVTVETQMQITASIMYPNSNVSCRSNGHEPASISFWVHPRVILTHNLGSDAIAYHGQTVIFTCTVDIVVGHPIVITWRSEDYIGIGGTNDVLQVRSNAPLGTTVRKMTISTMVTLTNRTRNNGTVTVETQMQIIASVMYPNSDVSCRANGARARTVTFFTLLPVTTTTMMASQSGDIMSDNDVTTSSTAESTLNLSEITKDSKSGVIGNIVGSCIGTALVLSTVAILIVN